MQSSKGFLDQNITRRFLERIGESLEREPLDLPPGTHRAQLKGLLGNLGEMTFYQLLDVKPGASEEEIHRAYSELAKLVHPSHATPLGMTANLGALELLFERATEAYLTLNDPDRSRIYQMAAGIRPADKVQPSAEQRREEQVLQGERFLKVGKGLAIEGRYHDAVQTLQQAVKLDPKAEAFALLGECQSHNPHWLKDSAKSFQAAVELSPHEPQLRAQLAQVLEKGGNAARAEEEFNNALALDPEFADAQAGKERLRARKREIVVPVASTWDSVKAWFGKKSGEGS